jgi:hypothetical protein
MKLSLLSLLGAALLSTACTGYVAETGGYAPGYYGPQAGVAIAVEDRPYYTRGPYYVSRGTRYRWRSGHYVYRGGQRVWVHGHYVSY